MNENTDNGVVPEQVDEIQSNAYLSNPDLKAPVDETDAPETPPEGDKKPEGDGSEKKARNRPGREERETFRLQQRIAELEAAQRSNGQNPPNPDNADKGPQLADFDDALEYTEKRAEWLANKAIEAYEAKKTAESQKHTQEQRFAENVAKHEEREAVFLEQTPDYVEKVTPLYQAFEAGHIPKEIGQAVLDSDVSEKIVYHLSKNPLHLQQLMAASNNPFLLNSYISEIEGIIDTTPQVAAVKKTNAPPPVSPVKGQKNSEKSLDEMDFEDFKKARESQLRR